MRLHAIAPCVVLPRARPSRESRACKLTKKALTEEKTLSDRQSVSTQPPSAHITGSNILEEGAK